MQSVLRNRLKYSGVIAALAAGSLVLSACGGGSTGGNSGSGDGEAASLRFYWWGSDERNKRMQEAIDIFNAENSDIEVTGEFAEWGGYWDKLATSTAGNDTPDVYMQEDRYIADYGRRGLLANLDELGVPTDDIDESLLASGEIDGELLGVPTGSNVYSVLANPAIFEEAGVELPDDSTWTWDDYVEISQQIHDGIPSGDVFGTSDATYNE